jgi:hypothetical protein
MATTDELFAAGVPTEPVAVTPVALAVNEVETATLPTVSVDDTPLSVCEVV